jgi:hypothetical protein
MLFPIAKAMPAIAAIKTTVVQFRTCCRKKQPKEGYQSSHKCYRCCSYDIKTEGIIRSWANNFTNLKVLFFFYRKKTGPIYVYKYTPFVRGDEKTGKPIILQKT